LKTAGRKAMQVRVLSPPPLLFKDLHPLIRTVSIRPCRDVSNFCLLREEAVAGWSDHEIAEKIEEEKKVWKQRAAFDSQRAAHSLVIVVAPRAWRYQPPINISALSVTVFLSCSVGSLTVGARVERTQCPLMLSPFALQRVATV